MLLKWKHVIFKNEYLLWSRFKILYSLNTHLFVGTYKPTHCNKVKVNNRAII